MPESASNRGDMTIDYKPNYDSREAHYAAKDAATAARDSENAAGGPKPHTTPKAHDFRANWWGHSANIQKVIDKGQQLKLTGFGSGIAPQDILILKNGSDVASYRVDSIRYQRDPPDQWFADASFCPGVYGVTDDGRIVLLDADGKPVE